MKSIAQAIAARVIEHVRAQVQALADQNDEYRAVFNGPPMPLLDEVFALLARDGGIAIGESGDRIPVLLPVLDDGEEDPLLNASGRCTANHLTSLRNSTTCPVYVVLAPPGLHANLTQTSTRSEFGLALGSSGVTPSINQWCNDPFIRGLLDEPLQVQRAQQGLFEREYETAQRLLQFAMESADEVDPHEVSRQACWQVLSRLWSLPVNGDFTNMLSLACGYPPCADGKLDIDRQREVLRELATRFDDAGFRGTIEQCQQQAIDEDKVALAAVLEHLQGRCHVLTAFARSAPYYYGPVTGDTVGQAPPWWQHLTVERWLALLDGDDVARPEAIGLRCTNARAVQVKGLVPIVDHEVELTVQLPATADPNEPLKIVRESGGARGRREWEIAPVNGTAVIVDEDPMSHASPLRYSCASVRPEEQSKLKKCSVRVVSLARWEPGVVVAARTATEGKLPRAARAPANSSNVRMEATLTLDGQGRHYVELLLAPGVQFEFTARALDADGVAVPERDASIVTAQGQDPGFDVDAGEGECAYEVRLRRPVEKKSGEQKTGEPGSELRTLRLYVSAAEAPTNGCASEFERLLRLNRRRTSTQSAIAVHPNRTVRCCDLQAWMLSPEQIEASWYPLVLAADYADGWHPRDWSRQDDTILSRATFLQDPRPSPAEMAPPAGFVKARRDVAARIRGKDDGSGIIESARLGEWMITDPDFAEAVESYVRAYTAWLDSDPEAAAWCDVSIVVDHETSATLAHEPDAMLVSPLHPVRLAWHCLAQRALFLAQRKRPCPAAAILDPDCVPDSLALALRAASGGVEWRTFLSVECDSDYWGILWNSQRLQQLASRAARAPFDAELGLRVGGLSRGFSESQVRRAMDDITRLLQAKPVLNVLVASAGTQHDACSAGLLGWCRDHLGVEEELVTPLFGLGPRHVHVLDERPPEARPVDAEISNLAEDTANAVRWYGHGNCDNGLRADLGILAQLETAGSKCEPTLLTAPLATGGLLRHRVRQQLRAAGGAYLAEARVARRREGDEDMLAQRVADLIVRLEGLSDKRVAYVFAPSIGAVKDVLDRADYAAISSAAVDPACFLGGWLPGAYLWDYDMPSYSNRAGDNNGYYLLSRVSEVNRGALQAVLKDLPGCEKLTDGLIDEVIYEVARRGIPTVRGLASGGRSASGDLGLFVAARLLQDDFRDKQEQAVWLPSWSRTASGSRLIMVLPVDPYRAHLDDLGRALDKDSAHRPDLLIVGIEVEEGIVRCKFTPVEVKFRGPGQPMPLVEREAALRQARSLSELLTMLQAVASEADGGVMWRVTLQDLLVSIVSYGFRVYSQQPTVLRSAADWSALHEQVTAAILGDSASLEIDEAGRLIVIDATVQSGPQDSDADGQYKTIVLSHADAGRIVRGDAGALRGQVQGKLGLWQVMPVAPEANLTGEGGSTQQVGDSVAPTGQALDGSGGLGTSDEASIADPGEAPGPGQEAQLSRETDTAPFESARPAEGLPVPAKTTATPSGHGVVLELGSAVDGFAAGPRCVDLSDTRLNQLNIGVVGDLGTGKTQFLKSLVYQVAKAQDFNRGKRPNFLVLDYKKDYVSADFVAATGARVIRPHRMPINVFDTTGMPEGKVKWLVRFQFFADVLDKIYSGIGPVQRARLKEAVKKAYQDRGEVGDDPTIYDVHAQYHALLGNGADSISSIIDDLVDAELFAEQPPRDAATDTTFDGVVVVALGDLGQDDRTKSMVVAFMLNLFYERMLRTSKQPYVGTDPQLRYIDSFLLVDEADNIMRHEFDVLRNILLQGREFGAGVVLASQFLSHFKAGTTDYREPLLTWFIHKVPNVKPQELIALGFTGDAPRQAERVSGLPVHQCLAKTHGLPGEIIRGKPFFELLAEQSTTSGTEH